MTTFRDELRVLRAVKEKKRPNMAWKTICKLYKELRSEGLIVKDGKAHAITAKGEKLLEMFGVN